MLLPDPELLTELRRNGLLLDLRVDLGMQKYLINKRLTEHVNNQDCSYYKRRRDVDEHMARNNTAVGKKGEFLAARGLHDHFGFPLLSPDMTIYPIHEKNWSPDLPYSKIDDRLPDIHVKACSKSTEGEIGDWSWMYQYANYDGRDGKDVLFVSGDDEELTAFVYAATPKVRRGVISAIVPWKIVKSLLRDPQKENLKGKKLCVYYEHLLEYYGGKVFNVRRNCPA